MFCDFGNYLFVLQVEVAVKTLHPEHSASSRDTFLKEAEVMMKLSHHCIVSLIGISKDPPFLMVSKMNFYFQYAETWF